MNTNTKFNQTTLLEVKFNNCNLSGVSFINSILKNNDFTNAKLTKTNFKSSTIQDPINADFKEALNVPEILTSKKTLI